MSRKPSTIPEVLKGTVHDKGPADVLMVSTSEQVESGTSPIPTSQEPMVVTTTVTPPIPIGTETPEAPTLTISGSHVRIPTPEPEGSLLRELVALVEGATGQVESSVTGERVTTHQEEDLVEVIEVDQQSEGS